MGYLLGDDKGWRVHYCYVYFRGGIMEYKCE